MSMERTFPLDIGAVKAYGVDRWRAEFSWPVSDQEFFSIAADVRGSMRAALGAADDSQRSILLVARELPIEFMHMLHAILVLQRLDVAEREPTCHPNAPWYPALLGRRPQRTSAFACKFLANSSHARWMHPLVVARHALREASMNPLKIPAFFRGGRSSWVYGSPSSFASAWVRQSSYWTAIFYDGPSAYKPSEASAAEARALATSVAARLKTSYERYVPEAPETIDTLQAFVEEHLLRAVHVLECMRAVVRTHRMRALAVAALGNPRQRALAIAVRESGGQVTSFAHGGFTGLFRTAALADAEFALSDTYVTYTEGSADLCERIQRYHPPIVSNRARIVAMPRVRHRRNRRHDLVTAHPVRSVMVVGFPMNSWRNANAAAGFALMQLHVELRIVDALRAAGYAVLYKAHPDRLAEVRGVFDDRAYVITEPIEHAHVLADAFVFGSMRTTAFPVALRTTKPVVAVLMDTEPAVPFSDALEFLERRCTVLRGRFDEHHRVVFDEQALCDALVHPPDTHDTLYCDRYLAHW